MEQDLFKFLPSEIIFTILSKLPVQAVAISKCVCKSWRDLLKSDEFVKSHLSTSAAALAVLTDEWSSSRCIIFDLEVEIDALYLCECDPLTKFNFPHRVTIEGSANAMLLLHKYDVNAYPLYVCNPITREYLELGCPEKGVNKGEREALYGFGASKISGQHKAVRIKSDSDCYVYTLGTGSWRRIEPPRTSFECECVASGAFVNGYLHWIVYSNNTLCITCFDLEMECFSTFLVPQEAPFKGILCFEGLSVLRDCLCYCDKTRLEEGHKVVIWLMKEYGDDKSWTKEYVINLNRGNIIAHIIGYPIKVFKDGGILMVVDEQFLFYYSKETKTIQKIGVYGGNNCIDPMLLTPSFLSLKSFPMENVISL